jgi:hypothetical protein
MAANHLNGAGSGNRLEGGLAGEGVGAEHPDSTTPFEGHRFQGAAVCNTLLLDIGNRHRNGDRLQSNTVAEAVGLNSDRLGAAMENDAAKQSAVLKALRPEKFNRDWNGNRYKIAITESTIIDFPEL